MTDTAPTAKGVRFDDTVSVATVPYAEHAQEGKARAKDQDYYFLFYSSLQNQANMMADVWRTTAYKRAIEGNAKLAIHGKAVLDLGAGSGILSYFAAGAGAKHVIALEASSMAEKISILVDRANKGFTNPHLKDKIRIVQGMVEDDATQAKVLLTGKVDTIVSEPIGVMLLHERMVESFLLARDTFLKPGGTLIPSSGDLFFAPFSDQALFDETDAKALFFKQTLFGTDFSDLYDAAREEVFAQPIVGQFPAASLIASANAPKHIDFYTCTAQDIKEFTYPLEFTVNRTGLLHGIASWFDLAFDAPPSGQPSPEDGQLLDEWNAIERAQLEAASPFSPMHAFQMNPLPYPEPPSIGLNVRLSTGPHAPRTHWQQARLLLPEPLAVNRGEKVTGSIHFKVNEARSYDLTLKLALGRDALLERKAEINLAQQCFNYSYTGEIAQAAVPYGA